MVEFPLMEGERFVQRANVHISESRYGAAPDLVEGIDVGHPFILSSKPICKGIPLVNLWWIAGETWCVDGHFSGSQISLCQDLFLYGF
jgi:hypothetical protein